MDSDFAFAFNDPTFSDRLLRIQITGDDEVSCSSIDDCVRNSKRRGQNSNNGYEDEKLTTRVKELHVCSLVLAAKSPFFFKLFSNGMLESEQRDVTLNIHASEEAAVMELLNFMYCNSLSVTTGPALLDVLMAADKYEVASCMKYCTGLLVDMPMCVEFALLLLDLPSSVVAADSVKPLLNAARQHLASHYKDISKFPLEQVLALPLVGIEAILESNDLAIDSEDQLYDLVLKWAKTHYSDPIEREEVLVSRLARFIRFHHMTFGKLGEIVTSNEFTLTHASKIILGAFAFKAKSLHQQRRLAEQHPLDPRATERAYKYKPIQIVEFEIPRHQRIVYLDLTRKECAGLYPSGRLDSQKFTLGGQSLYLYAECQKDQSSSFHHFGVFLELQGRGSESFSVDVEIAIRSKPTEEFVAKCKGNCKFTPGNGMGASSLLSRSWDIGTPNLLSIPWVSFMAKDCPYLINDILHLRAEISIPR